MNNRDGCKLLIDDNNYLIHKAYVLVANPNIAGRIKKPAVLFSAAFKNHFLLKSALLLNNKGYYGSARQLLRTAFEAMVLGKYISFSGDSTVLKKWEKSEYVNLVNDVFNKIKTPKNISCEKSDSGLF